MLSRASRVVRRAARRGRARPTRRRRARASSAAASTRPRKRSLEARSASSGSTLSLRATLTAANSTSPTSWKRSSRVGAASSSSSSPRTPLVGHVVEVEARRRRPALRLERVQRPGQVLRHVAEDPRLAARLALLDLVPVPQDLARATRPRPRRRCAGAGARAWRARGRRPRPATRARAPPAAATGSGPGRARRRARRAAWRRRRTRRRPRARTPRRPCAGRSSARPARGPTGTRAAASGSARRDARPRQRAEDSIAQRLEREAPPGGGASRSEWRTSPRAWRPRSPRSRSLLVGPLRDLLRRVAAAAGGRRGLRAVLAVGGLVALGALRLVLPALREVLHEGVQRLLLVLGLEGLLDRLLGLGERLLAGRRDRR